MPDRPDPETRELLAELDLRVGRAILLSYPRVAEILGVSPLTVRNMVATGLLAARGDGRGRRVTVTSLRSHIRGLSRTDVRPPAAATVVAPAPSCSSSGVPS